MPITMRASILGALLGTAGVIIGACLTPIVQYVLERHEASRLAGEQAETRNAIQSRLKALNELPRAGTGTASISETQLRGEIDGLRASLSGLQDRYDQLLGLRRHESIRRISYQLDVVKERLQRDVTMNRAPKLDVLGVSALGPIHQGREVIIETLAEGGSVRALLLDPESTAFIQRSHQELDTLGRIAAEQLASLYILADIRKQVTPVAAAHLQIRLYQELPDRSLVMIDTGESDGIALVNVYPLQIGVRGMTGASFMWNANHTDDAVDYRDSLSRFDERWNRATRITLRDDLLKPSWPYERQAQ